MFPHSCMHTQGDDILCFLRQQIATPSVVVERWLSLFPRGLYSDKYLFSRCGSLGLFLRVQGRSPLQSVSVLTMLVADFLVNSVSVCLFVAGRLSSAGSQSMTPVPSPENSWRRKSSSKTGRLFPPLPPPRQHLGHETSTSVFCCCCCRGFLLFSSCNTFQGGSRPDRLVFFCCRLADAYQVFRIKIISIRKSGSYTAPD